VQQAPGRAQIDPLLFLCIDVLNRRFKFSERSQLFIGVHNEATSVAVRVSNPDRSPVGIHG